MTYIVIEMQTSNGVTAIVPPVTFTDRNEAEGRFHSILSVAATSAVEEHAVVMITSDGRVVRNEVYRHPVTPVQPEVPEPVEPEGEEEPEET